MTIIVTADLHLTSHPRNAYRWDLFPVGFFDYAPTLAERLVEPNIAAHCYNIEAMG